MTLDTIMRNILFIVTALAIGSNYLYAQKRSSFSEIQNLDRFSTLSTRFEYIQNKKDTVFDGRFSIESLVRNKGVDSSGTFEGFSIDYHY
ncbi:MAG: hypothetical protein EA358_10145 [Flavobacteriales bacterium]|nr:MAG: hypothetical protein EA358_10145 [Flavobacteriales bacterium]